MPEMSVNDRMIELHMRWQTTMKKAAVPREFVVQALEKITSGEIESKKYPGGFPCLLPTYEVAFKLQQEQSTVQ